MLADTLAVHQLSGSSSLPGTWQNGTSLSPLKLDLTIKSDRNQFLARHLRASSDLLLSFYCLHPQIIPDRTFLQPESR